MLPPKRSEITKVVRDGTKTMVMPLIIPGMLKGKMISERYRPQWRPNLWLQNNVFVYLGKHVIEGQYHKGQEVVDHAQYNSPRCVNQLLGRKMKKAQRLVDNAVFFPKESAMQESAEENSST